MYFTGYRDPEEWAEIGLVGDSLSFTTDDVVTKLGIGYIKSRGYECAMDTAVRFTLLNAGENGEINAKQMLNQHTRLAALVEAGIVADGWYLDDEGIKERGWVFHQDGIRLFWNRVSSYYRFEDVHFPASCIGATTLWERKYKNRSGRDLTSNDESGYWHTNRKLWESDDGFYPIPLQGNERMAINLLDDKEVLEYINKSLNRMVKSGKAIQVTHGRGRTFRWNAWGWLDNYRQKHLVSVAKHRKLGDVVNGWEYTKGRVSNLLGVEFCDHEWHPHEPVQAFTISVKIPNWNDNSLYSHLNSDVHWTQKALPYLFFNEEEAREALEHFKRLPSNGISMKIDGLPTIPQYCVTQPKVEMTVVGSAEIEQYLSPQEMYMRMQLGDENMYKHLSQMLRERPAKIAGNLTTEKEE
jgi:hypothetical protein